MEADLSARSAEGRNTRDAVYFYSALHNTQTGTRGHESLTLVQTVEICPLRPHGPHDAAAAAKNQAFIGTKFNL